MGAGRRLLSARPLITKMEALGKMEEPQQRVLLHHICDDVCGKAPDYAVAYGVQPSNVKFHSMVDGYKRICLAAAAAPDDIDTEGVPEACVGLLKEVIAARLEDLIAAAGAAAAKMSSAHLASLDWKLNLMLSSDQVS